MKRHLTGLLAGGALSAALILGGTGAGLAGSLHGPHGPVAAIQSAATSGDGSRSMMAGYGSGMMGGGGNGGMMGGNGGMMGGNGNGDMMGMMSQMGDRVQVTSPAATRALSQRLTATATIDRQTHTITYHTRQVELVALGSPDNGPDMTWNVDGLVNPIVVIPQGAHVTVHFFDADQGTIHGWELTNTAPPYPYMAMMDAPVAFPSAFAMPVSGATAQRWFGRTVQFTASSAGTYYYICPVPGHAQKGMYGRLVVRQANGRGSSR